MKRNRNRLEENTTAEIEIVETDTSKPKKMFAVDYDRRDYRL